jgi:hypothetical protein
MFSFTRAMMPLHHLAALYLTEGIHPLYSNYRDDINEILLPQDWRNTSYLRQGWLIRLFAIMVDHPPDCTSFVRDRSIKNGLKHMKLAVARRAEQVSQMYG